MIHKNFVVLDENCHWLKLMSLLISETRIQCGNYLWNKCGNFKTFVKNDETGQFLFLIVLI
jgi:hypothetical protein